MNRILSAFRKSGDGSKSPPPPKNPTQPFTASSSSDKGKVLQKFNANLRDLGEYARLHPNKRQDTYIYPPGCEHLPVNLVCTGPPANNLAINLVHPLHGGTYTVTSAGKLEFLSNSYSNRGAVEITQDSPNFSFAEALVRYVVDTMREEGAL